MCDTTSYNLLRSFYCLGRHRLNDATYSFLIIWCQAPVHFDKIRLHRIKSLSWRWRTMPSQHVARVNSMFHKIGDVAQIQRIRAKLVVFLSSPTDSKQRTKISLVQT